MALLLAIVTAVNVTCLLYNLISIYDLNKLKQNYYRLVKELEVFLNERNNL